MTKTLNVYINNRPKNNTTPNNTKIVIRRGIETVSYTHLTLPTNREV